jgi:hypothetical protein
LIDSSTAASTIDVKGTVMTKNQKLLIGVGCLAVIVLGGVVFFAVGGAGYYFYRNPSPPENAFPQQIGKFTRVRPVVSSRHSKYVLHQTNYGREDGQSVNYQVQVFSSPEAANAYMNLQTSSMKMLTELRREPRTNQFGQQVGEYTVYGKMILFTHDSWYIEIRTGDLPLSTGEEFARGLPF